MFSEVWRTLTESYRAAHTRPSKTHIFQRLSMMALQIIWQIWWKCTTLCLPRSWTWNCLGPDSFQNVLDKELRRIEQFSSNVLEFQNAGCVSLPDMNLQPQTQQDLFSVVLPAAYLKVHWHPIDENGCKKASLLSTYTSERHASAADCK